MKDIRTEAYETLLVICEDFQNHLEYNTADDALREARELTRKAMQLASGPDIATVFYAYDPEGNYLGGDVWKDE